MFKDFDNNKFEVYNIPLDIKQTQFKPNSTDTYIALDTNILLDFYTLSSKSKDHFFNLLEQDIYSLYIPHHVSLEYQKNIDSKLDSLIKEDNNHFDNHLKNMKESFNNLDLKKSVYKKLSPKHFIHTPNEKIIDSHNQKIEDSIAKKIYNFKNDLNTIYRENISSILSEKNLGDLDKYRNKLEKFIYSNVGPPLTSSDLETVQDYCSFIRPDDFISKQKDLIKDEVIEFNKMIIYQKYADYIILYQILENLNQYIAVIQKISKQNDKPNQILFLTNDKLQHKDRIRQYFLNKTGIPFFITTLEYFMKYYLADKDSLMISNTQILYIKDLISDSLKQIDLNFTTFDNIIEDTNTSVGINNSKVRKQANRELYLELINLKINNEDLKSNFMEITNLINRNKDLFLNEKIEVDYQILENTSKASFYKIDKKSNNIYDLYYLLLNFINIMDSNIYEAEHYIDPYNEFSKQT